MSDRDLVTEIEECSAKLNRLLTTYVRQQRESEKEAEAERLRQTRHNDKLRRDHQEALAKKDFWRTELAGLEARFGKEFDALSETAKEATARRVLNDIDFPRWKKSPDDALYRHALLTGLLNEDSAESEQVNEGVG